MMPAQTVVCLRRWMRGAAVVAVGVAVVGLQACSSLSAPNHDKDPMEPMNRAIFGFNEAVDAAVLKPVATAYTNVVPDWARKGVSNFLNNLQDMWSLVNSGLQARGDDFSDNFGRVLLNTTVGLGGLVDVATTFNIDRHTTDFGTTLGRWGVAPGPYVVLPLLGPATLREVAALPVDIGADPAYQLGGDANDQLEMLTMKVVDKRANLLGVGNVLDGAALDKYSFIRDGYLQRQRNRQYDGNPPDDDSAP